MDFTVQRSNERMTGYTTNISMSGMFIATTHLLAPNTRVRLEVIEKDQSFCMEGLVTRSKHVPPELRRLDPSGIGVRFLEVSDLVRELFPNGFTKDAVETIPPAGKPPAAAGSDQLHLRVQIPSAEKMAEIYRREMSKGGLHLPSPKPAELGDIVRVELVLPYMDNKVIAFDSKVIHRLDPQPGAPVRWGMSVQFLDPAAVHASIKAL